MATPGTVDFIRCLQDIVGRRHVLMSERQTRRFCTGVRFGSGSAIAVVLPGSLRELWRVTQACVDADKIIVMQAANTGLTGGSTPDGDRYDRDTVLVNTLRMRTVHLVENGRQVICLPGATLDQLERALAPLGREPHSVIGSSCIGASVLGGVCNNSGGALVRRGPAFTEMALFGRVLGDGRLELVNHLEVRVSGTPEEILDAIENRHFTAADVERSHRRAHDDIYAQYVRDVDAPTPARFNADPARLNEASGCAGKLVVFAVRLDTFPIADSPQTFYIGTNDVNELAEVRRRVLQAPDDLPVAAEYLHRDCFNVAAKYGKDTFLLIQTFGARRMPALFAIKSRIDGWLRHFPLLPSDCTDRLLQRIASVFPNHIPPRLLAYRDSYDHHLMLKVEKSSTAAMEDLLDSLFPSASGAYFECSTDEARRAFLHRFCAAGAANRYRAMQPREVQGIVALDVALPRNERQWFETLPPELDAQILVKLYYGHFLCHVFHQDYLIRKGCSPQDIEDRMHGLLDTRGAEYPAEHNVGHLYHAKPALQSFYRALDPRNMFNPGVGRLTRLRDWHGDATSHSSGG